MTSKGEMAKPPIKIYGSAGQLASKVASFQAKAEAHQLGQESNPFSGDYGSLKAAPKRLSMDDPRYGRPPEGSKTEKRGKAAGNHVSNEIRLLCDLIHEHGTQMEDGTTVIPFGELFVMYTRISNKVVGILMRARKHGLLDFEGEMLYQRRDDNVPIILLRPIEVLRAEFEKDAQSSDP